MLGAVIEQASGVPYCEYIQNELFTPLSLERTRCDSNSAIIPGRAQGYGFDEGRLVNDRLIGMDNPGAAGMIISTARDLVAWNMALMNGEVVSAESLEMMTTPYTLNNGEPTTYGFGLGIGEFEGHRKISHGGGIFGFNSMLTYYPDDDVYIAVISNSDGARAGNLAKDIAMKALGIEIKVADLTPSADDITKFSGTFVLQQINLEAKVFEQDGFLHMQATDQPAIKLLYQGDGEFRASFDTSVKIVFDITTTDGPAPAFILFQGGQQVMPERKEDN